MTRYPKAGKGTKWTIRELKAIPDEWNGDTLSDGEGLTGEVRATQGGSVSVRWRYAYRWEGKLRWFQCGTFPEHDLADIRSRRDFAKEQISNGIDPTLKKQAVKIENRLQVEAVIKQEEERKRQNLTVQDLFDVWVKDGVARKDGNANLIRSFNKDVLPEIGSIAVKDLTEHHIRTLYKKVLSRGVERTVVDISNSLGQMLRWADKRQPWRSLLVDGNPAALVEVRKLLSHDYSEERDRILTYEEIRELRDRFASMEAEYEAAPSKYAVERPLQKSTQLALWICLSTMCRIGELLKARWRDIDFDEETWFIPGENTKAHRSKQQNQTVFLSKFALEQFKALHEISGTTEWLFPAKQADAHVSEKTVSKQVGDRQMQFKNRKVLQHRMNSNSLVLAHGVNGEWTPHDLRRTGATMMQSLGVPLEIIDRCQNHLIGGSRVRRHYLHYDYAKEKRDAWAKLGDRIKQILTTDNLLELRGAA